MPKKIFETKGKPLPKKAMFEENKEEEDDVEEENDDDLMDEDDDDEMDDMISDYFWSLTVKPNDDKCIIEEPQIPGFVIHVTSACFGEHVNKASRTVLYCTSPTQPDPTSVCVLIEGTHESQSLDLIFGSAAKFELKGRNVSPVYLSGYLQPPQDNEDLEDYPHMNEDEEEDLEDLEDDEEFNQPPLKKRKFETEDKQPKSIATVKAPVNNNNNNKPKPNEKKNNNNNINNNTKPTPAPTTAITTTTTAITTTTTPTATTAAATTTTTDKPLSKNQQKKLRKQQNKANAAAADKKEDDKKEDTTTATTTTTTTTITTDNTKTTEPSSSTNNEETTTKKPQNNTNNINTNTNEVKKLANGIEFKDLKIGDGAFIKNGQTVRVFYVGQKEDKTVFDKVLTGDGFEFKFGSDEIIKGWNLGMKGMKVGGKRRVSIPPKFAYGAEGKAPEIPPNATLTFTIEVQHAQ